MMQQVDEDFQRKIDNWNSDKGGPSYIAVAWNPVKERWQVFAIPIQESHHPLAKNHLTQKLMRRLPDESGREGVLLFTWCNRDERSNDVGFEPLDDRLFQALDWADSFKSKRHFEETIKEPEIVAERTMKKRLRDIAGAATEYWYKLDSLTINPNIPAGGDWRGAKAWWR